MLRRILFPILIATSVAACASATPAPTSDFCQIYRPVDLTAGEWAGLSDRSADAIDGNNAAYDCVCRSECPQ